MTAELSNAFSPSPTFAPDQKGTYRFSLVVNDGEAAGTPDTVAVVARNRAPVAHAGADQGGNVGEEVQLDASGCSDPDGDDLTYLWRQVGGPVVLVLSDTTGVGPTFTPTNKGTFQFALAVNDGEVSSTPDTMVVQVINRAPTANAGPDQEKPAKKSITLDGSGSTDPDGDSLTYAWGENASNPITNALSDTTAVKPTLTPSDAGTYRFTLVVNDGEEASDPDEVQIVVVPVGSAEIVGEIEDDTGEAEIIGEIEEETGDAEVVGEIEEDTGDAEITGTVEE